jgi:multidrug resistance efflux pump
VKSGQPLYEFDATIQTAVLEQAKAGVAYYKTKVKEAEELGKQHAKQVEQAEKAVELADRKVGLMRQYYVLVDTTLEKSYEIEKKPKETWDELKKGSADLYKAKVEFDSAMGELDAAKLKRDHLKASDPKVKVREAEAAVKQAEAEQAKAQSAVDLCVVKARTAGTVEQVTIGPGTTLGIGTLTPALWLIPSGPRVVRAEVEAEFAHRLGADIKGKSVTIYDHTDAKLTYSGTVRRKGTTFLLKRGNAENLLGGDTRVLEVVIEVSDPNPAGKPPLLVGQRVRVNLGQ